MGALVAVLIIIIGIPIVLINSYQKIKSAPYRTKKTDQAAITMLFIAIIFILIIGWGVNNYFKYKDKMAENNSIPAQFDPEFQRQIRSYQPYK